MAQEIKLMPANPYELDKYMPETFNVVGKRGMRRIDGYRKASGTAIYTKDIDFLGMLYAKFLKCPYPNAKIKSMDTSKAEVLPGVRAVLRYDDPEIKGKKAMSTYGAEEDILADYAYFEGEEVGAVVAADTEDIADEALKLIDVEWEQRPFVLDEEEAAQPGAILARPELYPESNELPRPMWVPATFEIGDIEKGFKEADKIIEFKAKRRYHGGASVEAPNGISRWEGDCLELWVHHQHPYEHKWAANSWFGIPMSKVKVNCPYNGAMYGGWNWIDYSMVPQCVSAILAKRTGKPVKWIFDRRDDFYFGQMDVMVTYFRVGFKNDGTITAVKMKTYFANLRSEAAAHLLENTRIPNMYSETIAVQVNKGPVMAVRCEQAPPAFGLIHVFDRVAAELGMDPTELALKNDG
ncbi:MAG: xanthine dehydrogenase family protein molybdopterin-binding subunit, partial [Dehalococcoidia bacterium]|nr:xanthine dehydrogenase family protein molybdopterin-binding subunit [Dehalococcoidia bacterium]